MSLKLQRADCRVNDLDDKTFSLSLKRQKKANTSKCH